MSVYYYLASREQGEAVRVGQGSREEMKSFYSGIPLAMAFVGMLLQRGGEFVLLNDVTDEYELAGMRVTETDGEVREPEE